MVLIGLMIGTGVVFLCGSMIVFVEGRERGEDTPEDERERGEGRAEEGRERGGGRVEGVKIGRAWGRGRESVLV